MDLEAALRTRGCRVTRARRIVWQVISAADVHLSAQAITARVHDIDPAINESSVYRTLTLFAEAGLVRESRLDDVATWEQFHEDTEIHLVCTTCGTVTHHDTELVHELRRDLERAGGFSPIDIDVRVAGRCSHC